MSARHRQPDRPDPAPTGAEHPLIRAGVERTARLLLLVLAVVNALVGAALLVAPPGTSPALLFLASLLPLPVWASGWILAAVLLLTRWPAPGHALAAFLWLLTACGSVVGLVTGRSTAPAASLMLTVLIVGMAADHVLALTLRRRLDKL